MTAEKKDRKPLRIKNLADLKRHIRLGTELVATAHQYPPDIVGLTRVVTKVQTNGFYSKIKDRLSVLCRRAWQSVCRAAPAQHPVKSPLVGVSWSNSSPASSEQDDPKPARR